MKVYVDANPKEVCCVMDGKVSRAPIDGENTNNMAEYRAVLFGLYKHPQATEVCSDSQLIVKQLNGEYAVRKDTLKFWYEKAMAKLNNLGHKCVVTWVPRGENPAGKVLG